MTIRDIRDPPSIDRFDSSEDPEPEAKPKYRTAQEGAINPAEIMDELDRIATMVQIPPSEYDEGDTMCSDVTEKAESLKERINLTGIIDDEYEWEISRMRELIENASRYMMLGNFRQKVPRKTILHFKDTMKAMNAIIGRNKYDRLADED